jgi:hypothetical protein
MLSCRSGISMFASERSIFTSTSAQLRHILQCTSTAAVSFALSFVEISVTLVLWGLRLEPGSRHFKS